MPPQLAECPWLSLRETASTFPIPQHTPKVGSDACSRAGLLRPSTPRISLLECRYPNFEFRFSLFAFRISAAGVRLIPISFQRILASVEIAGARPARRWLTRMPAKQWRFRPPAPSLASKPERGVKAWK
jgi:hypothetical protein